MKWFIIYQLPAMTDKVLRKDYLCLHNLCSLFPSGETAEIKYSSSGVLVLPKYKHLGHGPTD